MAVITEISACVILLHVLEIETAPCRQRVLSMLGGLPDDVAALRIPLADFLRQVANAVGGADACTYYVNMLLSVIEAIDGPHALLDLIDHMKARLPPLGTGVRSGLQSVRPGEAQVLMPTATDQDGEPRDAAAQSPQLIPPISVLEPSSSLCLLLRRCLLAHESLLFDGVDRLVTAMRDASLEIRHHWDAILGEAATRPQHLHAPPNQPLPAECVEVLPPLIEFLALPPYSNAPSQLRHALSAALAKRDLPSAIDALHGYFDHAYGQAVAGGSAVMGLTTAIDVLTPSITGGQSAAADAGVPSLSGPMARVRELLLSSTSAQAVGGAALGRPLLHASLLPVAALHMHFGHREEAADALRECMQVAQACGDAAMASYVLRLLAGLASGEASGEPHAVGAASSQTRLTAESVDLLRRVRQRACDLGLWRQQVDTSLLLVEHAVVSSSSSSSSSLSATSPAPVPLPDWLSLDPFTSYRQGGFRVGSVSASSTLSGAVGAGGTLGPTLTATGRDGIGAAATTAITSATATMAAASARRSRALNERDHYAATRRPSTGDGGQSPMANAAPVPGVGAVWSSPAPLHWGEVCAMQAEGHEARARMWEAVACNDTAGDRTQRHSRASQVMAAAARRCAAVANAAPCRCIDW